MMRDDIKRQNDLIREAADEIDRLLKQVDPTPSPPDEIELLDKEYMGTIRPPAPTASAWLSGPGDSNYSSTWEGIKLSFNALLPESLERGYRMHWLVRLLRPEADPDDRVLAGLYVNAKSGFWMVQGDGVYRVCKYSAGGLGAEDQPMLLSVVMVWHPGVVEITLTDLGNGTSAYQAGDAWYERISAALKLQFGLPSIKHGHGPLIGADIRNVIVSGRPCRQPTE